MDTREHTYQFLDEFKKLEDYLRREVPGGSRMDLARLLAVAAEHNAAVRYHRDALDKYRQLRNVLVHRRGRTEHVIAVPTEEALEEFRAIVAAVVNPPTLEQFRKELRIFGIREPLPSALRYMRKNDYSQVVVQAGSHVGLLTVEGVARWLGYQLEARVAPGGPLAATVGDVMALEDQRHWMTLPPRATVYDAADGFSGSLRRGTPRLFAIIITDSGEPTGRPIGIVTPWDLLDAPASAQRAKHAAR